MSESSQSRIIRLIQETLDTHLDLLAVLLAENGKSVEEQVDALDQLVQAANRPVFAETIFEDGRRLPAKAEAGALHLNLELLERVEDSEVLGALSRPVAQLLNLAPLSLALAFQARDERQVRDLTTRATRGLDAEAVGATDVPSYVRLKMNLFGERVAGVCRTLGNEASFAVADVDEVVTFLRGKKGWPEYVDVSSLSYVVAAVEHARAALADTPYEGLGPTLVEIAWDGLALSTHSFFRHAGRIIRGKQLDEPGAVMEAIADAIASRDGSFNTALEDSEVYGELYEAWKQLVSMEQSIFGGAPSPAGPPSVSLVDPAIDAFGLDEPKELPWELPLACWTSREHNALRDLMIGVAKTLPGTADQSFLDLQDLQVHGEQPLGPRGEKSSVGIQVIALTNDRVFEVTRGADRAWSAALESTLGQFGKLDVATREAAASSLRAAYDDLFPSSKTIWDRRFRDLDRLTSKEAFKVLVMEIQTVLRTPVLFDPFIDPQSAEIAPFPTLVFTVGVPSDTLENRVPFWIPLSAISSTTHGAPLRVRVVHVPSSSDEACRWVCDRALHLNKLQKQAVELIMRSIRLDALQMAVFK